MKEGLNLQPSAFAGLVPDLDKADRRDRRLKAAQVDPKDVEAVDAMRNLLKTNQFRGLKSDLINGKMTQIHF